MRSVELMALAAPRAAAALACWLCGHTTEAWQIADDVLRCTTERQVPQAQAVAAVTSAIMAQLDGEREVVVKLAGEALHVADEVSTRQWRQWARSLQWWAGEGIEEPELPGPLLRPYFQMLLADDERTDSERAFALLDRGARDLPRHRRAVLRGRDPPRAGWSPEARRTQSSRLQTTCGRQWSWRGCRERSMLELRALTDWARLERSPDSVRADLRACIEDVAAGGPSRSLDEARRVDAT